MTAEMKGSRKRSPAGPAPAGLVLACASLMVVGTTMAQEAKPVHQTESPSRLLTAKEGRAIVNVAWQQDLPAQGAQDCSHLVHEIYSSAGFAYPYASSFEIYAGNENFVRVKYPRPGDVIAWPGHVGIVVDPLEHSFYSLVRTGLEEQNYESPYWKSRGRRRFYRFRVETGAVLTAARTESTSDDMVGRKRPNAGPPAGPSQGEPDTSPSPDRRPYATRRGNGASRVPSQDLDDVSNDAAVPAAGHSLDRSPAPSMDRPQVRAAVYGPPAPRPEDLPGEDTATSAPVEVRKSSVVPKALVVPKSLAIDVAGPAPTREEVAAAISDSGAAFGGVLNRDDAMHSEKPIVIVEQFSVEKVEIKRNHGWARLAIDSKVLIAGGTLQAKRRHEKTRWDLQRTTTGWEAALPADRVYVPRDVAVKNLAANLARIAPSDGAARHDDAVLKEEAAIASALSALLDQK